VNLGELPEKDQELASIAEPQTTESNKLNVSVTDLTGEQRKGLEIKENGVLVNKVGSGPARKAGIRRGDVILMINHHNVSSTRQFEKLLDKLPKDKLLPVLIQRGKGPIFLTMKLEE
jgi:serine protease Do